MTVNFEPKLDDVLTELAALPTPPSADALRGWLDRYPAYRRDIIAFMTDWVEMEAARVEVAPTRDDLDEIVNLTMSQVQRLLEDTRRSGAIEDLIVDIRTAGHDLESFQRAVGIDRSMLTCLAERTVKPAGIPARLVNAMATALNRLVVAVRAYFLLPQQPNAAYKARGKPQPAQVDFRTIVEHADLPDAEKVRWLAEPADPELRG